VADKKELQKIRGTVMKFVSMLDGETKRSAGLDMAPWRSPARTDFIVWHVLEEFGGTEGIPLAALQDEVVKAGYTWDDSMRQAFDARLRAYGMKVTDTDWDPPNYNTPTREKLLKGEAIRSHVTRLVGKFWS